MNLWSRVQRNFFDSQLGQFLVFAPSRAYIGVGIDADEVLHIMLILFSATSTHP